MNSVAYRKAIMIILIAVFLSSCGSVPITGRSQLLLIPESEEMSLGLQAYRQTLSKARLSSDSNVNAMINRVGRRIAAVANKPEYQWEFRVIDEPKTANAFALPGGKVAIYTGLLPYTQTEDGLAFVVAHEVGHVIARHGGERMSQQMLLQYGQQGLNAALQGTASTATLEVMNTAYGIGSALGVLLPFSRAHEYEADEIGLSLMAKAGYDQRQAPNFFKNMLSQRKGGKPPEFLSTHPADDARIQRINQLIGKSQGYYKR